jgi:uncharacterized membrane protein YeaQ/YmgE (transglycosylase-associated protein family)
MPTVSIILSWAVWGLIVGFIARLLLPGRRAIGFIRTILLGIVGALLGGLIYWAIWRPGDPVSFLANA